MIFTDTNLIDQATAIRLTRQMVSQALPAATPSIDREQALQALTLAVADLDVADPLYVLRTVDTAALIGQRDPQVRLSTRHFGMRIVAIYHPAQVNDANSVPFDLDDHYQARIRTQINSATMLVVIRWPRRAYPIPVSDAPAEWNPFQAARCMMTTPAVLGAPTRDPADYDGERILVGDRFLVVNHSDATLNGVYALNSQNRAVRPLDAWTTGQYLVGRTVAVAEGDRYGASVWYVAHDVTNVGTDAITLTQMTYDTNVDADQATAHVIPRAAAYLTQQYAALLDDAPRRDALSAWAAGMLARPLPITAQALSLRVETATHYAHA